MTKATLSDPAINEGVHSLSASPEAKDDNTRLRRRQFTQDRFGIFVHFGISSILEGWWKGECFEGLSEWIMYGRKIPLKEYQKLADQFEMSRFDAEAWVKAFAATGARYMVYVAKHHDGFAMFHSHVSDFNIVDATPFGRDPLKELSEACARHDIRLGVYYSHVIDWEHPHAWGPQMNDWDFSPEEADFDTYWREKALPQIEELCTQYGDLGVFWFDMPAGLSDAHAEEAAALVRRLQPGAVINSRIGVGNSDFDYVSTDDNYPSNLLPSRDWEMCATMNTSWGWKRGDDDWKSASNHLYTLAHTVSRNGNYLLNVGPMPDGSIPSRAIEILNDLAEYKQAIDITIHGAKPSSFKQTFPWGVTTQNECRLFLHVFDRTLKSITLPGKPLAIKSVIDLLSNEMIERQNQLTEIPLPPVNHNDEMPRIVAVELEDELAPLDQIQQVHSESLHLDIWQASITDNAIIWKFIINEPGIYRVDLISKDSNNTQDMKWHGNGLEAKINIDEQLSAFTINPGQLEYAPLYHFWHYHRHQVSEARFMESGEHTVAIYDLPITDDKWAVGRLNLVRAEVVPE
ncbi:alpha-L-fucosidase [Rubellicoccus peritrichatus]|uniref:alpha-L-fucosidase n=1 Tax=Rubellicoccus peritrichatus TaxID=3080537 RepID=A0AAQ3LET5_9BACT|nr:alpha-L-fucosidase [Puniceicoccus sp. CR14]WOO43402.1 alpha-L-fucosidase [Puniceicoccus sp. CR14]